MLGTVKFFIIIGSFFFFCSYIYLYPPWEEELFPGLSADLWPLPVPPPP